MSNKNTDNPFEQAFNANSIPTQAIGDNANLTLHASAVKRLHHLRKQEGDSDLMLRIAIFGGGCSGYQYRFSLDSSYGDNDKIFSCDGASVVSDIISLQYLDGAEVEFVEELSGSAFRINNPNADSSCGCGVSFSV